MGFFSWLDSKDESSIPAYPYAGREKKESEVVLVLPDDSTVAGVYDGYGNIDGKDVYELIAPFIGLKNRDEIFSTKKTVSYNGEKKVIYQFDYEEPLKEFGGLTLNELVKKGAKISTNFDKTRDKIKIVKKYNYKNEKYKDLAISKDCPDQGFFYGY